MLVLELIGRYYLQGLLCFGLAILGVISYRLLFHPLASYPGPLLARITDLYGGVLSMRKKTFLVFTDLHEKQGPVIRVGPNRLLFNTATAFQDIYRDDRRVTKAWTYELISRNRIFNVFNTLDRDVHRAKRRIISSALSKRAIDSFEPALISQVDVFLEILQQAAEEGSAVNMTERMSYLATDIIGLMALGYELETQTREENRHVPKSLFFNMLMLNIGNHLPPFSYLYQNKIFDLLLYSARERFVRLLEHMVQRRLSLDTHAVPDLFSFVAEAVPKYVEKTRAGAIWKESIVFMTAGGDTVASGLTGIFFYLSRYPDCYKKAAEEVRSNFADVSSIKGGSVLQSCHYLRACIDESLRMSPPISATLWRQQVEADKGPLTIDGHHIPRGTFFGVNIYALSHNPDIFPDPYAYNPDRWLTDDPALPKMKESFASFGIGPRDCTGKQLAYLELMLVAAKTLHQFDFERAPGPIGAVGDGLDRGRPDEFQILDGFNSAHDGPYLVFRPRV